MSLHTIVIVHCDACGERADTATAPAPARKRAGWTTYNGGQSNRRDYCPACSKSPTSPDRSSPTQ